MELREVRFGRTSLGVGVEGTRFATVSAMSVPARRRAGVVVRSAGKLKISGHEDGNRIYECAVAGKTHYIVTENKKHFPRARKTTQIVSARQLLAIMIDTGKPGVLSQVSPPLPPPRECIFSLASEISQLSACGGLAEIN